MNEKVADALKIVGGVAGVSFLVAILRVSDDELNAYRVKAYGPKPGEFRWTDANRWEK